MVPRNDRLNHRDKDRRRRCMAFLTWCDPGRPLMTSFRLYSGWLIVQQCRLRELADTKQEMLLAHRYPDPTALPQSSACLHCSFVYPCATLATALPDTTHVAMTSTAPAAARMSHRRDSDCTAGFLRPRHPPGRAQRHDAIPARLSAASRRAEEAAGLQNRLPSLQGRRPRCRRRWLPFGHHHCCGGRRENRGPAFRYRLHAVRPISERSEERRVGKECRSRWSPY